MALRPRNTFRSTLLRSDFPQGVCLWRTFSNVTPEIVCWWRVSIGSVPVIHTETVASSGAAVALVNIRDLGGIYMVIGCLAGL